MPSADQASAARAARHLTAIVRNELSRPVRYAIEDGVLGPGQTVLDYGCGRGGDAERLTRQGVDCAAWDPVHRPEGHRRPSDVVNLGYVINVIENPVERVDTLRTAWGLCRGVLVVSVRTKTDQRDEDPGRPYEDGCMTRLGTFQKYYEQGELRDWVDAVLEVRSVVAAPGVLYVFRDEAARESFQAARTRRQAAAPRLRKSDVAFETHRHLLEPLMAFFSTRGRLPSPEEFELTEAVVRELGSLRRAFRVIQNVTSVEPWDRIRDERTQDLLVYVALSRFGRRPTFSKLPRDLQLDVRAFFSTYTNACSMADLILFSAGDPARREDAFKAAPVGKLMPTALYVHSSAVDRLPAVLRIFEGCGRSYVGRVEDATVIKMHRDQARISYLGYPDFDTCAHPPLRFSLSVHLQSFAIERRSYEDSDNPPILHRKEEFIPEDNPLHAKFAQLTRQEVKRGLFADPARIGTQTAWDSLLAEHGLRVEGHRLRKARREKS
jgi:DNA phosphorothioation-associated putative methyltransferase